MTEEILKQTQTAVKVVKTSFKTVLRDPQILFYPIVAAIVTPLTFGLIGHSIFNRWYNDIFQVAGRVTPNHGRAVFGLVTFSVFYAAFVAAIFTCAVSASVLARLEGHPTKPLAGLKAVAQHFFRVSRFALLSVFLFPIGIFAQRRKLPKGIIGVLGSSFTLHMANIAPAILTTHKRFNTTVREAITTLGEAWKAGLILKIAMYAIFTIVVILPKLIQHHFSPTASNVGWIISLEFAASGLVIFKIINAIITTVLYHHAKTSKTK